MSTTLDAFFPYVLPQVPGASDPLVQQAIRSAAIDFCTRTDLIQRITTPDATINVMDYTITPPTDMTLTRVLSVSWSGRVLSPEAPSIIQQDVVLRNATVGTTSPYIGDPQYFFQKSPSDSGFSLYPVPQSTLVTGLTVKASYAPANTATTVDDVLFSDWVEAIAAGAIAQLAAMPGQPFSSVAAAQVYGVAYRGAIAQAKRQVNSGKLPSSLRVMPQRFA